MQHWNYRVVRTVEVHDDEYPVYKVVEVYYDQDGNPRAWSDRTDHMVAYVATAEGDPVKRLRWVASRLFVALWKPVLVVDDNGYFVGEERADMKFREKVWCFIHNAIAHPLLVFEGAWSDRFHDWTADKAWPDAE